MTCWTLKSSKEKCFIFPIPKRDDALLEVLELGQGLGKTLAVSNCLLFCNTFIDSLYMNENKPL